MSGRELTFGSKLDSRETDVVVQANSAYGSHCFTKDTKKLDVNQEIPEYSSIVYGGIEGHLDEESIIISLHYVLVFQLYQYIIEIIRCIEVVTIIFYRISSISYSKLILKKRNIKIYDR